MGFPILARCHLFIDSARRSLSGKSLLHCYHARHGTAIACKLSHNTVTISKILHHISYLFLASVPDSNKHIPSVIRYSNFSLQRFTLDQLVNFRLVKIRFQLRCFLSRAFTHRRVLRRYICCCSTVYQSLHELWCQQNNTHSHWWDELLPISMATAMTCNWKLVYHAVSSQTQ